jgi:pyruvate dehydrogenase E2 component (dihydrolipoamide acetyltransferase)
MVAATTTVPQFTVRRRVDMSRALALRDAGATASGQAGGARAPGVIDVLYLAVARALRAHPEVNASFEAGTSLESSAIVQHEAVNLGIAVALPEGLLVPVLHSAQAMTLEELAAARARLQEEARTGRLSARALTGATFTVSNLGTMNVDEFTAIVNPPEAAILAVGRMQQELVVRDGAIHTLPMISLTITADHRVLDGAQVALFLETLANYLEHPEALHDGG